MSYPVQLVRVVDNDYPCVVVFKKRYVTLSAVRKAINKGWPVFIATPLDFSTLTERQRDWIRPLPSDEDE
jgi:hypothetical protein